MSDALALIGDGSDMIAALVARRKMINKVMDTFDPDTDVVLDYGDPLIFAMIIYYLADHDKITVGRYNRKTEKYIFHAIDEWWIKGDENGYDSPRH